MNQVAAPAGGSLQQLLQNSGGKNIIIRDPKTGQQLMVQSSQSGQPHLLLQKGGGPGVAPAQQLILQTKDGHKQIIQVQGWAKPGDQQPSDSGRGTC